MPVPSPTTLVTFALAEEAAPFRQAAKNLPGVSILITGMGRANTEQAIQRALRELRPQRVITSGYAGALEAALKIGEIVFSADEGSGVAEKLLAAGARPVKFFCSPAMLVTAAQKAEARRHTGAQAVEMESEFIRRACRDAGLPSATVRAISDLAEEDFPLDFNRLTRPDQSLDPLKFAGALVKSPGAVPGLLRLRRNTRQAAQALAGALAACLGMVRG
jgi:uridine phosphorylase